MAEITEDRHKYLEARLTLYYSQPYTPHSFFEARRWENECKCPIVSDEEADFIKKELAGAED